MPKLSADEIASYAAGAGFKGEEIKTAVAIALAESGGNTQAHNSKPPDDSYGLWQINMLGSMGPARRKQFGIKSNDELFDPATNARAAYMIYKGSGWKAWTTYTRETYKRNDIQNLIAMLDPRNVGKAIGDEAQKLNPINGVSEAINAFGTTVFKGVAGVIGIGVAITLLVIGVVLLVMSSGRAQKAASVAANVIPGGNVVKGAVKKATK
jgi:hypothetical protein